MVFGVIYEGGLNPDFNDTESIGTTEDRVLVSSISSDSIVLNVEEMLSTLRKGNIWHHWTKWRCCCWRYNFN